MGYLNVLIGLPGCGKSTYAKSKLNEQTKIVSSDTIRKELYGNEANQGNPSEVFNIMFSRTLYYLHSGFNVIYDATNINLKKRYNLLSKLKTELKDKQIDYCFTLFAVPYNYCLANNNKRERKVPQEVIQRMYYNFEMPVMNEGWTNGTVIDSYSDEFKDNKDLIKFVEEESINLDNNYAEHIPHDNPHHKTDISTHMKLAAAYLEDHYTSNKIENYSFLKMALDYHDIGKFKTKVWKNDRAVYYNHANVGAYDFMTLRKTRFYFDIAQLINYHMRPFDWERDENLKLRDLKYLGPKLVKVLEIIHDCDIHCEDAIV